MGGVNGVEVNLGGPFLMAPPGAGETEGPNFNHTLYNISDVEGSQQYDRITGNNNANSLSGNGGDDTIDGGGSGDVIAGGAGADTIKVRDGAVDRVTCGTEADMVEADWGDTVNADCESVHRTPPPDTTAPIGSVKIDGGRAVTPDRTVRLTLKASDPAPGSGVASMRIKNAGGAWKAWQPYAASRLWKLTPGAGNKVVYVEYRDRAGNVSVVAKDSIRYRP